jgi:hypothetical protein
MAVVRLTRVVDCPYWDGRFAMTNLESLVLKAQSDRAHGNVGRLRFFSGLFE